MAKELAKKPTSTVKRVENSQQEGDHPIAITSMILGVVSLTALGPISGIPAVILGIIGLNKSSRKGLSIAGIVTGGISILITLLVAIILLFVIVLAASEPVYYDTPLETAPSQSVYNET